LVDNTEKACSGGKEIPSKNAPIQITPYHINRKPLTDCGGNNTPQ
jgi:hypothetical protein